MVVKTERFEMRLDEEIINRVDAWRAEKDGIPSRAEAMRQLIEIGLSRSTSESVNLTDGEKLMMLMLRDIYKQFKVKGEIDEDFIADVIFGGHYWALKWTMTGVFHDMEDDPRELEFVVKVMTMWSLLEHAYKNFTQKEKDKVQKEVKLFGKDVKFRGFDGNIEASYGHIAGFLIKKMNRFRVFKGRSLNSIMPMVPIYRRMLNEYEPMLRTRMGDDFDVEEVIRILKAGVS